MISMRVRRLRNFRLICWSVCLIWNSCIIISCCKRLLSICWNWSCRFSYSILNNNKVNKKKLRRRIRCRKKIKIIKRRVCIYCLCLRKVFSGIYKRLSRKGTFFSSCRFWGWWIFWVILLLRVLLERLKSWRIYFRGAIGWRKRLWSSIVVI